MRYRGGALIVACWLSTMAMAGIALAVAPSASATPDSTPGQSSSTTGGAPDNTTRTSASASPRAAQSEPRTARTTAQRPRKKPRSAMAPDRMTTATRDRVTATITSAAAVEIDVLTQPESAAAPETPTVAAQLSTPRTRPPSLANLIGSVVLNVLVGAIHLADGPPVLPPGSTVTVATSRLTVPVGNGRSVQSDWYFPEDADASTRLVYLQHGFMASGPMYSYTAARLAERTNSIVVAPSLSSNFLDPSAAWVGGYPMQRAVADLFVGDREALVRSASAAAGREVTLPQEFVLVGHSAGGTLVTAAAGYLADNGGIADLAGVVLLDGVEPSASRAVETALAKLTGANDRPVYLISSQRYFWSRGGDMADKLGEARPDRFNGVSLEGGWHGDYLYGGNPLIQRAQYLITGVSAKRNVAAAEDISAGWVNDLFAGTRSEGIYGAAGQRIAIVTPDGTATAVVLPLGPAQRTPWQRLVDGFFTRIFDWAGRSVFVYEPISA
ncbi:alpha/beta fold hydrolase [Mycobacterium sp. MBM]|nr:alpha/beta fold hydrolase [Mycobacterium sp. MBM]